MRARASAADRTCDISALQSRRAWLTQRQWEAELRPHRAFFSGRQRVGPQGSGKAYMARAGRGLKRDGHGGIREGAGFRPRKGRSRLSPAARRLPPAATSLADEPRHDPDRPCREREPGLRVPMPCPYGHSLTSGQRPLARLALTA